MGHLTILFFGDIVGKIGREAVKKALPDLKARYQPDLTIANAENIAHGKGVTPAILKEMLAAGIDFFTSGNHVFNNPKIFEVLNDPDLKDRFIRPANYPAGTAGEGWKTLTLGKKTVLVVNLMGQVFMTESYDNPFRVIDEILGSNTANKHAAILVDLHGEATSEKIAFGLHVDGSVSAVVGTHTHVPTADARVLPKGTAYVTDVGMVGARHSILGVDPEGPLSRFKQEEAQPFVIPESGPVDLNAVVLKIDDSGRAGSIAMINEIIQ